ncbi:hypothetical protein GF412_03270 [Candidatus Micrarchaeota archaeon]|nr:hypothetical protein [Candidatus Micrarchaeota archaeon]MBD3417974.1 hypothetical protein [Candidatus Micrarchaeota archaeon]
MKLKLTPELSYIIGLWKETRTREGIGVYGGEEHLSIFTKAVLDAGLTESTKLLASSPKEPEESDEEKPMEEQDPLEPEKSSVYFYHTSYRKFFQKIIDDELERFKYKNEYSANFLAGLFDAVGRISADGKVSLSKCTQKDEMLLYRLGFNPVRRGKLIFFTRPAKFLAYIKPFTRKYKTHAILSRI